MLKTFFFMAVLAVLPFPCRADLITFGSEPSSLYAATTPVPTPPGDVTYPDSVWLTPTTPGPQIYVQDFTLPADWELFGVSLAIKTNGPTEASINGTVLANVTDSTILNILPYVHAGVNVLETPLPGDGVEGLKIDDAIQVFYQVEPGADPDPASHAPTPEPATLALAGCGLLGMGLAARARTRSH
jgi:hypothetical protein